MPALQRLIDRGTMATVASAEPLTRETLLTTLATGLLPDRHGVLGPLQIRADGGGVEATGRRSWQAAAFWEVLEAAGIRTACIDWPATAPAIRWPGIHVDDRFTIPSGTGFDTWNVPPGCVSPPGLEADLADLRLHPADPLGPEVMAFVPGAPGADPAMAARLAQVGAMVARAGTTHAAAAHIAATPDWDVLCVAYDLLHLAKLAFMAEPAGGLFDGVIGQACALLDMMLGRLVALAGEGATVMVVSPNGLSPAAGNTASARPRGMMVVAGPGIAADALLPGARLVDIAPTLLARYGLSLACDGAVLTPLTIHAPAPRPAPELPGIPAGDEPDPALALIALGYVDTVSVAQQRAMADAEAARLLTLGIALTARGQHRAAAAALEAASAHSPDNIGILRRLARCRVLLGEYAACLALGRRLLAIDTFSPWGHLILASWAALGAAPADPEPYLVSARALGGDQPEVLVRIGGLELLRHGYDAAAEDFTSALAIDPDLGEAAYGLGVANLGRGDPLAAELWMRRAIAIEHNQPLAHWQLGAILAGQNRLREAALSLETALAQNPGEAEIVAALDSLRQYLAAAVIVSAGPA